MWLSQYFRIHWYRLPTWKIEDSFYRTFVVTGHTKKFGALSLIFDNINIYFKSITLSHTLWNLCMILRLAAVCFMLEKLLWYFSYSTALNKSYTIAKLPTLKIFVITFSHICRHFVLFNCRNLMIKKEKIKTITLINFLYHDGTL